MIGSAVSPSDVSGPLLAQDILARRHPHHVGHVRRRRRHLPLNVTFLRLASDILWKLVHILRPLEWIGESY